MSKYKIGDTIFFRPVSLQNRIFSATVKSITHSPYMGEIIYRVNSNEAFLLTEDKIAHTIDELLEKEDAARAECRTT